MRKQSKATNESKTLSAIINRWDYMDAKNLGRDLDTDEDDHDPLQFFTYWSQNGASRIDRFYPTNQQTTQITVTLDWSLLQDESLQLQQQPELDTLSNQDGLNECKAGNPIESWDEAVKRIQILLHQAHDADTRQSTRYFDNLRAATRLKRNSREEILYAARSTARLKAARSFGKHFQPTAENTRYLFKRNSNWQRDQTVSEIKPSAGHFYKDDYPVGERMASEWSHVFGETHATTDSSRREKIFHKFVHIPEKRKLTQEEAKDLVKPISVGETLDAIQHLQCNKARGTTGLNHDIYKDFQYPKHI
ncbi:Hypothetical protein PHPALM_19739 [Phytophthora palmivora]|uniref:Uncharacterized protein n=1 Tax=Phytophthora palmivora TaxID=4796 RepID=A0A2P4XGM8_9STRA|nr:Hypothetical protein PHPALM_19739 [Phytophthora palmivora]